MIRDWAALVFAMVFPTLMSWVYFIGLATQAGQPNPTALLAYGVGKGVQFTFPFFYALLFDRSRLRPSAPTARGLGLAIGFGSLVAAGMFVLYAVWLRGTPLMEVAGRQIIGKLREFGLATPAGYVLFGGFISVVHSLFEEYYFRWFIFGGLKRYLRLSGAVALSALAFMAHHIVVLAVYFPGAAEFLTVVLPFSLCVAVGGAVWAWLYDRAQSLYAPWLSHLIVDVAIMVVGYDLMAPYLAR